LTDALRARFGFDDARPLILAASTHAAEEAWLLEAFKLLRNAARTRTARLLIAPRHPERFNEVAALVASSGLTYARRSAAATSADPASDVILLDSIGELRAVYPLAALVFVGGSLVPTGGHNVLEPAVHAKCIVTGAHTFNFAAIVRDFLAQQALVQLPKLVAKEVPAALAHTFQELLADDERRRAFGARALAVLAQNRGATARTVELLKALLRDATAEVSGPTVQVDHAPLPPGSKTRKADMETRLTSNF
jgi:3-deoxy-D-manno-octulosonic-acid transferase